MTTPKNSNQDAIMVAFMKANPDLASGNLRTLRARDDKWQELNKKLNLAGPPVKDVEGWKKVWKNKKYRVRQRMLTDPNFSLPTLDEAVAIACGMYDEGYSKKNRKAVKKEPLPEEEFLSEKEDEENASEERKPKRLRLNPIRPLSNDSQYNSAASSDSQSQPQPMSEILKTLQEMTAQQANHFRAMETLQLQKLEVSKAMSENIAKLANKYCERAEES